MKVIVRWEAVYETELEVKDDEDINDRICDIDINVRGSEYQDETYRTLSVTEENGWGYTQKVDV